MICKFDQGVATVITTLNEALQRMIEKEKKRRAFLAAREWEKLHLLDFYTLRMDPCDVEDHRIAKLPCRMQSHKWTVNPLMFMFTKALIAVEALHVLLADEHNERLKLEKADVGFLTPLSAKQLRRKLGAPRVRSQILF